MEKKDRFSRKDRKPFGEHGAERKHRSPGAHGSFGERRRFDEEKPEGERSRFGAHKPYGGRRQDEDGHKPFEGRRSFEEHKPFERRRSSFEGRRPFAGPRKPMWERRSAEDEARAAKVAAIREARPQDEVRLNKFIANSGVCSRREADQMIQAGVVTVNGQVVTELGVKVNPLKDDVRFNGERLKGEDKVYVIMNKPRGYVTTMSDPHADKTVMDLVKGCSARVFPVGRLDKNTTGVLMLTNDGEMAERLTHPSYDKKKIYQATLDRDLAEEDFHKILSGIELADGPIKADELEFTDEGSRKKIGIEIHSGKNRIVRRIFESLGYDVKALDRVYFAGLTKKGLKRGEWRYLNAGEENLLKMGAYL